jgi:hypothetical protein
MATPLPGRQPINAPAVDLDFAALDGFEPGNGAQQGRFAAARGPEHHQELAGRDVERNPVQHHGAAEVLADASQCETAHASPFAVRALKSA